MSRAPRKSGTGAEPRFVFLACSERSGSNLISSILGAHPRIKSPPPYHFARDVILNLHAVGPGAEDAARKVLNDQMLHMARTLGDEAQADRLGKWLAKHPAATGAELARFVYAGLVDKPGADTVVVKENNLHRAAFFVLAAFPDAKFIFQVRDPRDYLASAKARKDRVAGNKFGSFRNALTVWREDQLGGLALLGLLGPERVFFQRYEDLVSNPPAVLKPLCKFLGVTFDPAMLDFHEGKDAARLAGTSGARENLSKPLMADNFGKYRKSLSSGEVRTVETWLGDLMDRFGYARDYPARTKPRGGDVFWPQLTEPFERLLNGERLPFYASGTKRLQARLREAAGPVARPYAIDG